MPLGRISQDEAAIETAILREISRCSPTQTDAFLHRLNDLGRSALCRLLRDGLAYRDESDRLDITKSGEAWLMRSNGPPEEPELSSTHDVMPSAEAHGGDEEPTHHIWSGPEKRILLSLIDVARDVREREITSVGLQRYFGSERNVERAKKELREIGWRIGVTFKLESVGESTDKPIVVIEPSSADEIASKLLDRELTTHGVAVEFGVRDDKISDWIREGLPHSVVRRRRGGPFYLYNADEVRDWLATRPRRPERIPAEEARPKLREIRDYLNMSLPDFAALLGAPVVTVKSWLGTGGKIASTIPKAVMDRAVELLRLEEVRPSRFMSRLTRTKDEVTNALTRVSGSKAEAARLLGIPRSTLESLIDIYELESMVAETLPLAAKIGRAEIKRALEASGGHITGAARALGISPPGLRGLIRQYGIENEVARAPETPLTPESIRQAASETDGTARAIASKLGSTSSAVRSAAARFGIELRHERQRKVFRVECDALKRAIEETDGTRAAVAQKLGISSRVTITEAAKRCGLEGLLKHPLRRVTRAEFEEALRSTDRTRRAVAEFLGINFGTVAKLAERFGLESKLVSGY